jgi:apolipoprotein N-acyltransferase
MTSITRTDLTGHRTPPSQQPLSRRHAAVLAVLAAAAFHAAYEFRPLAPLVIVFLYALLRLTELRTARQAFYVGLLIGLAVYVPQLWFFSGIFKTAALGLWLVAAIWIALFLLIGRSLQRALPPAAALLCLPVLWTGLEYFRSELYYLRFSWLSPGYAFSGSPALHWTGVYGMGFLLMLGVAAPHLLRGRWRAAALLLALGAAALLARSSDAFAPAVPPAAPFVVGIQLEQPSEPEVLAALDEALAAHPNADLFVLSEYTFASPPPPALHDWCRRHRKHLVLGAMDPLAEETFYNTAFVIGPDGESAFRQAKSVPIQFFSDGLPAPSQQLWQSPWGRIGLCICYDLSYTRVVDELIGQGAQALIVPTMDLISWGEHEHNLHARVAPTRAAEYGISIFRVCSSGISQLVAPSGAVLARADFPGQGQRLTGRLVLDAAGRRPLDRWLAPACSAAAPLLWVLTFYRRSRTYAPRHTSL